MIKSDPGRLKRSLVKQDDLGLIPAQMKWFFLSGTRREEKIDPDKIKLHDLAYPFRYDKKNS